MNDIAEPQSSKSKRILRNTLALYVRMFVTMCVSLYTSRIVLNVLGADDYGLYNVVGSIVVMFYFLNGAMAGGTQRFLNYEMGCGTKETLQKTFNASLAIHIIIAAIILILAETIGLWFVNYKLVIPPDRITAANWVYQFSIFSAMISLTQVPYTAAIIAHERMNIYGYIGILEALLKLSVALMLLWINFDKLILYGALMFFATMLIALIYRLYCIKNYPETHFTIVRDKKIYKSMIGFSSWNLIGNLSGIMTNQGQNIVLNLFFGPVVNAARAIATSVNGVVLLLVNGFTTAMNPQITKSWATNDKEYFMSLVLRSSKFSYYLLFILAAPVFIQINYILKIWLLNVPEMSDIFCRLAIVDSLVYCVTLPLLTSAQATGNIKLYETTISIITILNLPISYVLLKYGWPAPTVYVVTIFTSVCALCARLIILKDLICLSISTFVRKVLLPCWSMFIIVVLPLSIWASYWSASFSRLVILLVLTEVATISYMLTLGTSSEEKRFIKKLFNEGIAKFRKNE